MAEEKFKYCRQCGRKMPISARFCSNCGCESGSVEPKETKHQPVYEQTPVRERKTPKAGRMGPILVLLLVALAVGGIFVGGHIMEEIKYARFREQEERAWEQFQLEHQKKSGSSVKAAEITVSAYEKGMDTSLGSISETGYRLDVENGTFADGSRVSVTPLSNDDLKRVERKDTFTLLQTPVEVKCDTYNGAVFSSDVLYTVPLPEKEEELDRLVFMYFDDVNGGFRYLWPDQFDLAGHTMSVRLPHFSKVGSGEFTDEGQIEAFLDKYAKKLAVERDERKQAAEALEPYVRSRVEALGLKKEAEKDLILSVVNYLGGKFKGDDIDPNEAGDMIESITSLTTGMTRAVLEGDKEGISGSVQDATTYAIMNCWEELGYSKDLGDVLDNDTVEPTANALLSNTNALVRMTAYLTEKDWKSAGQELGSIMMGLDPKVDLATKAVVYAARQADLAFINWKTNEIEELYQIYKNGAEDLWGNYVIAQDKETFLEYLSTASGFGGGKMIERFYNLDQIKEVCDKYGWSFEDYKDLKEKYRDVFEGRAKDALIDYFDTRLAQEAEAEKIKEYERISVNTMLKNGLLKSGHCSEFFGENAFGKQFDLEDRMERLIKTRSFLSQFVNEEALMAGAERGEFNWGDLLKWWATDVVEYGRQEALQRFLKYLRQYGLLKEGMERLIHEEEPVQPGTVEVENHASEEPAGNDTVQKKGGYWQLKETNVTSSENEIGTDGYASYYYSASELTHTERVSLPKNDYHGAGSANLVVSCSAPPQTIIPGEPVAMDVYLQAEYGGDYMLWTPSGSVQYGSPNDERNALAYNAGIHFEPVREGDRYTISYNPYESNNCTEVHVWHAFEKGRDQESEMAILFYGNGSNTLWIYGWVEE